MKLPSLKKLLREDLKDAPDWIDLIISPFNTLVDAVYFVLNKNISFQDNISCINREVEFYTPSDYSTGGFNSFSFQNTLKRKCLGVLILQTKISRQTYAPITSAISLDWIELDGTIYINYVTGLEPSKYYKISLVAI